MDLKLLEILRCPTCQNIFNCISHKMNKKGLIIEGALECTQCENKYPIIKSIPRFVPIENYTASFGYQWNLYKYTQLDNFSKISHSEQRFFSETQWTEDSVKNNWVLDAGCGNGRFVDICSHMDCEVVGIDMSSAIDAAGELFKDRENVHLIQADIYHLPFAKNIFDKCYSIGVIQHTPNPSESIKTLTKFIREKGHLALTIYEKNWLTPLYGKYLVRRLTKKMNQKILLLMIKILSPILFSITEILFRIPVASRLFKFMIPYANYVDLSSLSMRQRYEWAILDTFDMLSPAYDKPMSEKEVRECLEECHMKNITRLSNPGVNIIATK